jgi:hypothetical protein
MPTYKMHAREFKKMRDPNERKSAKVKYVCYIQASSIPSELKDWMETNPRDQKMTTSVATTICRSLEENPNFHELNRGIVMSVEDVDYNTETEVLSIEVTNPDIHGNIDGGHTLRAIFNAQDKEILSDDRYVFAEIFTGLLSPVELAAARNTSVQVDLKSIEELKNSFAVIKDAMSELEFSDRIAYKMNEHYEEDGVTPIDVREIITILNMFNQALYPIKSKDGTASDSQPIQSYTGKEISLKRFLGLGKENREEIIYRMKPIIPQVFRLWDTVEREFPLKSASAKKKYGSKKYAKYDNGKVVGTALFSQKELKYLVPKGIIYPVVGAFRALIDIDPITKCYRWKADPIEVWNILGTKLATIVLEEKEDNPEYLGKSGNLWSNLFKEVLIFTFSLQN